MAWPRLAAALLGASAVAGVLVGVMVPAMARLVVAGDPGLSFIVGAGFLAGAVLAIHAARAPVAHGATAWGAVGIATVASLLLFEVQVAAAPMYTFAWMQTALALAGALTARLGPQTTPSPVT